jgi:hypothetical protein
LVFPSAFEADSQTVAHTNTLTTIHRLVLRILIEAIVTVIIDAVA